MSHPKKFRTDHLPFGALMFDVSYQRQMIPARIRALRAAWNLADVGAITVSLRDGKPYIIDGQHRVHVALDLGLANTKVLCHIYTGLTEEEEARKFLALNNTRAVAPIDRYNAAIIAGDPVAIGVRDTLAARGLKIGSGANDSTIKCVVKALNLYERDPELLGAVCDVLTGAWGTRPSAFEQALFTGVGLVLDRYNGELDRGILVRKLSKYRGGASALLGDARGLADIRPISVTRATAEIVRDTYNRGRSASGSLDPL